MLFICSNFRRFITIFISIFLASPNNEVRFSASRGFCPTLELIPFTSRYGFICSESVNAYTLINLDIFIFTVCFIRAVVPVPIDMSQRCCFFYLVDSNELNCVGLFVIADIFYLGIIGMDRECLARKYSHAVLIICISPVFKGLHNPMVKDIACRRGCGSSGRNISIFKIQ